MKDRVLLLFGALLFGLSITAQPDTATIHIVRKGCIVDLTLERLHALPLREATMTERDGSTATYQGAWLGEVLDLGCDSTAHLDMHGTLRSAVKVTAVDGFTAVVAMAEAVHDFSEYPAMLAWSRNGRVLSERHGPLQLVVPDDRKPGRNVRQVKELEVITP